MSGILAVIISLLPVWNLLTNQTFPTQDGTLHLERIAEFAAAIKDGQIIPRWAGDSSFGFGSPALMYYGQLPYFISVVLLRAGANLPLAMNLGTVLSFFLSGIFYYLWAKKHFGRLPALVGTAVYVWSPYRFLDAFIRGAYPECFALIFPPAILWSADHLVGKRGKLWSTVTALFLAGLILSHNVMALFFIGVYLVYCLLFFPRNWLSIRSYFWPLLLSLGLSAFFWIPAILEKQFVNIDLLSQSGQFTLNFIDPLKLIYSPWGFYAVFLPNPMSTQLGLIPVVILVISLIIRKKILSTNKFYLPALILLLVSAFLMTPYSRFLWDHLSLLSLVIYPWRFLALAFFSLAVIGAATAKAIKNPWFSYLLIILTIGFSFNFLKPQNVPDPHVFNLKDTGDVGGEFLPRVANLKMVRYCQLNSCQFPRYEISPTATVTSTVSQSNFLSFNYQSTHSAVARINIFAFPGWHAYLDKTKISNFSVNELGGVDILLPPGEHSLTYRFENTIVRTLSGITSLVSLVLSVGLFFKYVLDTRFRFK